MIRGIPNLRFWKLFVVSFSVFLVVFNGSSYRGDPNDEHRPNLWRVGPITLSRRLAASCHWDVRRAKTVCVKADGGVWYGPAGDKIEVKDDLTETQQELSDGNKKGVEEKEENEGKDEPEKEKATIGERGAIVEGEVRVFKAERPILSASLSSEPHLPRVKKARLDQGAAISCGDKPTDHAGPTGGSSGIPEAKAARSVILFVVDDLQPDGVSGFGVRPRPSSERKAYQVTTAAFWERGEMFKGAAPLPKQIRACITCSTTSLPL
jgi:hypothetical protein